MGLMPELHGRCQTVDPNNMKSNSNLISPLNFLNREIEVLIQVFLLVLLDLLFKPLPAINNYNTLVLICAQKDSCSETNKIELL